MIRTLLEKAVQDTVMSFQRLWTAISKAIALHGRQVGDVGEGISDAGGLFRRTSSR